MVKINGCDRDCANTSVKAFLEGEGYDISRVAVEVNEDIVPKSKYDETFFCDGDTVEVVSFVGGG